MSKYKTKFNRKFFKDSRISSTGPKAFEGFKPFIIFITPSFETWMSRSWLLKQRDLTFRSFEEYICKLTIELLSLLSFRLSQTTTISLFERRDALIVFPLTVGIPIEVFGVNLDVTKQFVNIQIMLFLDMCFDLLSQFLKRRSEFTTASLFCLCTSFIPFSNLPSNLRCNPRDGSYRSLVLEGIYLSTASCTKEVIKLNRTRTRMTIEIFILCKVWRISPQRVKVTLLMQINLTPWFLPWRNKDL